MLLKYKQTNLWMCTFEIFQEESLSPPVHLCANRSPEGLSDRGQVTAGRSHVRQKVRLDGPLFFIQLFLYLQLFPLTSPFHLLLCVPIPGFCWLPLSVPKYFLPVFKTWMIVLTSGQRTSICDANQERNWYLKKKKLIKPSKVKWNLDVHRTGSWLNFPSPLVASPVSCILCPSEFSVSSWTAEIGWLGPAPRRSRCAASHISKHQPHHLTSGAI